MARLQANLVNVFKRHRNLTWLSLLVALTAIGLTLWSYDDGAPRAPHVPKPIAAAIPKLQQQPERAKVGHPDGHQWREQ